MSCHTSAADAAVCVSSATALYAATAIPLMRLARAEHLTPRFVRELPVTTAALLMLLSPAEVTR